MTDIEKIIKIIENNSPELAAEEILCLFNVVGQSEQFSCYLEDSEQGDRCKKQCGDCVE